MGDTDACAASIASATTAAAAAAAGCSILLLQQQHLPGDGAGRHSAILSAEMAKC